MRRALALLALASVCSCVAPDPPVPPKPDVAPPRAASDPSPAAAPAPPPAAPPQAPAAPAAAADPAELDARFVPHLEAVFREYKAWGRVDDELRWAPWLCRMPLPGRPRKSVADDGAHARKLYSVFAKHQKEYPRSQGGDAVKQPADQAIVKESYHPELVEGDRPKSPSFQSDEPLGQSDHFDPFLRDGERVYRASHLAGLYVILKVRPGTAGTDAGWIYGTLTPRGEVTSAGRVASCMGCHVTARHERVFGLNPQTNQ